MKVHQYRGEIANICYCNHFTADDIYKRLKKLYPKVGISTVYRNVEEMAQSGELKKIQGAGPKALYEKNIGTHAHFVCEKSGKVYDLDLGDIKFKNLPENFCINDMDIRVYGTVS